MREILRDLISGYSRFMDKYSTSESSLMEYLHDNGQNPKVMVVSCCDSRVDPSLLLQCEPGDVFTLRNIANIVPPYECNSHHHGTSAALELGLNVLNIQHLIILGHSQCSGIRAWIENKRNKQNQNDENKYFMNDWLSIIDIPEYEKYTLDECSKLALKKSYQNCLTFPWIKEKINNDKLMIHLWFFDIKTAQISKYDHENDEYVAL